MYRFVGGKGGVGKTTCAAGVALTSAARGLRTLLISTDPAPSLGDALELRLAGTARPVAGTRGRLHAMEIDAAAALERWVARRRGTLEQIALRGTWLDRDDVSRLLRLSLPGIDEIAGLLEVSRLGRSASYDLVVVDTAPTGHTLRMLSLPAMLRSVASVFDHMQAKHRVVVEALRGRWEADAADALIEEMDREGAELAALFRDRTRTALSWVTLPEPMAVEETADALASLPDIGMPLDAVIVNRLTPAPDRRCRWCDARRAFERAAVRQLRGVLSARGVDAPVIGVDARAAEPEGRAALAAVGEEIASARPVRTAGAGRVPPVACAVAGRALRPLLDDPGIRLALFGGKGGVGKTTCAAAAAIDAAAANRSRRVLLLSTDPAHSLGDALGARLSDVPASVRGAAPNLRARELDAESGFAAIRTRYAAGIDALFDRIARGSAFDAAHDRRVMRDLIELAPPGIDELVAILEVTDALSPAGGEPTFDLVVMDTAPSGHALRLLEMPALVQDWVKALMAILLKYQPVAGVGEIGGILLRLSQGLGRLRELMGDGDRTRFIAVTRPASLPRAETGRLLQRVAAVGLAVPAIVVNAAGAGTCRYCATVDRLQRREIRATQALARRRAARVVITPAVMPPPRGAAALVRWMRGWRELDADRGNSGGRRRRA